MIATVSGTMEDFRAFSRERQFDLDPPSTNTFIPHATVSLIENTGKVEIRWSEGATQGPTTAMATRVLDQILVRARRDVERFPNSARVRSNLGLALINSDEMEEASREFENALAFDPTDYVAILNLARVRVAEGSFQLASELYRRLRGTNPGDSAPLIGLAHIAMRQGDFSDATSLLREAVRLDQRSALAQYQLAVALLALEKPQEAIAHLRVAANSDVRSPAVHQGLAVAYTMSGDLRRALRSFRTALTLEPLMREAIHGLSNVLFRLSQFENVTQLLTSYLEKRPEDLLARENLAFAYHKDKRYSSSRGQLMQVLEGLNPETEGAKHRRMWAMQNIGVNFAWEGDLEEAERWVSKAIALCPNLNPLPYQNLARFYLKRNHLSKAAQTLKECDELFPGHEETSFLLAVSLERQARYDEAIKELQGLLARGSCRPDVYSSLGCLLADIKRDLDSGLGVLKKGIGLFPKDLYLINNLAYVHLLKGELGPARLILASVPADAPANVYLTCTKGLLLLWEGNLSGGQAHYLEAKVLARKGGNWELAKTVTQKMHLELARAHIRGADNHAALAEVERGLKIKGGKDSYREDLQVLLIELLSYLKSSGRPAN